MGIAPRRTPYVLLEEKDYLITEKPSGLLCVPGRGPEKADCLYSRLLVDYPELLVVHRLDQATSGLMLWARNKMAQRHLSRQFELRIIKKEYDALIDGPSPHNTKGMICLKQHLDIDNRPMQIVDDEQGKEGITHWQHEGLVNFMGQSYPHMKLQPQSGRTHQLRLHMAHSFSPILGDALYGSAKEGSALALHASNLSFLPPVEDFKSLLRYQEGDFDRVSFQSKAPFLTD